MKRAITLPLLVFVAMIVPTEAIILLVAAQRRADTVQVARDAAAPKQPDGIIDSTEVDRFVQETLRRSGIPGALLTIVKSGSVVHLAGYGRNADGSPVTTDTMMAVASLSKSFTAMAVMQLVVKDVVSLDTPVRQYLPEFTPGDARAGRITVRQLLNHSSGLTFESLPGANVRGRSPLHRSLEERVAWLSGATLRSEPGTRTTYDNFGYEMLARLVERVSGKPFADYLRDEIFLPLGMRDSKSFLTTRDVNVPAGHTIMFGIPVQWQMPRDLMAGAGGVATSGHDLARWLMFQTSDGRAADGRHLLPPEVMAAMHTASAPGSDYGFGWRESRLPDGSTYYHHSGRIVTYAAHQALYPTKGIAYAFVTNGLDPIPAGPAGLIAGLGNIVSGRSPAPAGYGAAVIDHLVLMAVIVAVTMGIVGVVRSGEWARRRATRPLPVAVLRCLPYAAVVGAALLVRLVTVPWSVWWETWPPFAVAYPVIAIAAASIVVARCIRLAAIRRDANLLAVG
jgi:CubicO group peptidase (beta-lactamase class C family)